MGRSYSQPEVVDCYDEWRISRVRDPDDEFAAVQHMNEDFVFVDADESYNPLGFTMKPQASLVLEAWKAGVEAGVASAWIRSDLV